MYYQLSSKSTAIYIARCAYNHMTACLLITNKLRLMIIILSVVRHNWNESNLTRRCMYFVCLCELECIINASSWKCQDLQTQAIKDKTVTVHSCHRHHLLSQQVLGH